MAKSQPKDIQRTSLFPSSKTLGLVAWETMFSVSVAPGLCCQARLSYRGAVYQPVDSPTDVCGTTQERAGRDVPVLYTPGRNKSASWGKYRKSCDETKCFQCFWLMCQSEHVSGSPTLQTLWPVHPCPRQTVKLNKEGFFADFRFSSGKC